MEKGFLQKFRETAAKDLCLRSESDIRMTNPIVLAYVGDTIYDLFVRTRLIYAHDCAVRDLHKKSTGFVKAGAQGKMMLRILSQLTDEEQAIFRRGRNAKQSAPKNADVQAYHVATGFEAVLGYLFFTGQDDRLLEVLTLTRDENTNKEGE